MEPRSVYFICDKFCGPPTKFIIDEKEIYPQTCAQCGGLLWPTLMTPDDFEAAKKIYILNRFKNL